MTIAVDPPLAGIRVVDAVTGPLAPITRYMADLGARVDRLTGSVACDSAQDIADNAGKNILDIDLDSPDAAALIADAHIIVGDASHKAILQSVRDDRPEVVTMSASDFGIGNSLSQWQEAVRSFMRFPASCPDQVFAGGNL